MSIFPSIPTEELERLIDFLKSIQADGLGADFNRMWGRTSETATRALREFERELQNFRQVVDNLDPTGDPAQVEQTIKDALELVDMGTLFLPVIQIDAQVVVSIQAAAQGRLFLELGTLLLYPKWANVDVSWQAVVSGQVGASYNLKLAVAEDPFALPDDLSATISDAGGYGLKAIRLLHRLVALQKQYLNRTVKVADAIGILRRLEGEFKALYVALDYERVRMANEAYQDLRLRYVTNELNRVLGLAAQANQVISTVNGYADFLKQHSTDLLLNTLRRQFPEAATAESQIIDYLNRIAEGEEIGLNLRLVDRTANDLTFEYQGRGSLFGLTAALYSRFSISLDFISPGALDILQPHDRVLRAEMQFGEGSYSGYLGYVRDERDGTNAARGVVKIQDLFELELFVAGFTGDGLVAKISLGAGERLPVSIPIGSTGFALQRLSGHFARNYRPALPPGDGGDSQAERVSRWAMEYAENPLTAWQALGAGDGNAGGVGLFCDVVTFPDNGFLISLRDVGFGFFTEGPVIYFTGNGVILDSSSLELSTVAVFAPGDGIFRFDAAGTLNFPAGSKYKVIEAAGSASLQASFRDPKDWFLHFGTDRSPIRGKILSGAANADAYFMVDSTQIRTGGYLGLNYGLSIGPFSVRAYLDIRQRARLGWNPLQIATELDVRGGVEACIWRGCIGFGISADVQLTLPRPTNLRIHVSLRLNLPWPLPDVTASGTLLNFSSGDSPQLESPLPLHRGKGLEENADYGSVTRDDSFTISSRPLELGAFHAITGQQQTLSPGQQATIWPDTELIIPFSENVVYAPTGADNATILNGYTDSLKSGGYTVTHTLRELKIFKLEQRGSPPKIEPIPVTGLQAVWAAQGDGSKTNRLHLPGEDPFEWALRFTETSFSVLDRPRERKLANFGSGAVKPLLMDTRFGDLVVEIDPENYALLFSPFYFPPFIRLLSPQLQQSDRFGEVKYLLRFEDLTNEPQLATWIMLAFRVSDEFPSGDLIALLQSDIDLLFYDEYYDEFGRIVRFGSPTENQVPFSRVELTLSDMPEDVFLNSPSSFVGLERVEWLLADPKPREVWNERHVFQPGNYRLVVAGSSRATGHNKNVPGDWSWTQPFKVGFPTSLRPYIRFSTAGDSRIFGFERDGWNPTPYGVGFPFYRGHAILIRFWTPYLSEIFPALTLRVINSTKKKSWGKVLTFSPNTFGDTEIPEASKKWREERDIPVPANAESRVSVPWYKLFDLIKGTPPARDFTPTLQLEISMHDPFGDRTVRLDAWSFQLSRFRGMAEHLTPRLDGEQVYAVTRAYSKQFPLNLPTDLLVDGQPINASMAATGDAEPADKHDSTWMLPWDYTKRFSSPDVGSTTQAALEYTRLTYDLNLLLDEGDQLSGALNAVRETTYSVIVGRNDRPDLMWVRTPEPLDWRRVVKVTATVEPLKIINGQSSRWTERPKRIFDVSVLQSPDGSSAFLALMSAGQLFQWPMGIYTLVYVYSLRGLSNLPAQVLAGDDLDQPESVEASLVLAVTLGEVWPEEEEDG